VASEATCLPHGPSQGFAERFPETVKNAEAKTPKEFTKIRRFHAVFRMICTQDLDAGAPRLDYDFIEAYKLLLASAKKRNAV